MKYLVFAILLILSINGFSQDYFWSYPSIGDIVISTIAPNNIGTTDMYSGGMIVDNNPQVTQRGVVVHTSPNPTIATYTKITADDSGAGLFSSYVYNLSSSTLYYVRAYAINNVGTTYGEQYTFTTGTSTTEPEVTTYSVSEITDISATCGGYVTDDGGASVTARGVCWIEKNGALPTVSDDKTTDGTGIGGFTSSLTSLDDGTAYYVRAYATNSVGTSYGDVMTFSTNSSVACPSIQYAYATSIGTTTATLYGYVGNNGGGTISERGWVYGKSSEYSDVDIHGNGTKLTDGSGTGLYNEGISALSSSTQYIVRAYSINEVCVKYSPKYYFTTTAGTSVPTVTTDSVNSIVFNGGTLYGNVTATGGASITDRGFEVSSHISFTVPQVFSTSGTTGSYNIPIDEMNCVSKTYFFRAYATNSNGTGYGEIDTLITSQPTTITQFKVNNTIRNKTTLANVSFNSVEGAENACDSIATGRWGAYVFYLPYIINDASVDENDILYSSGCIWLYNKSALLFDGSDIYVVTIENGVVSYKSTKCN